MRIFITHDFKHHYLPCLKLISFIIEHIMQFAYLEKIQHSSVTIRVYPSLILLTKFCIPVHISSLKSQKLHIIKKIKVLVLIPIGK